MSLFKQKFKNTDMKAFIQIDFHFNNTWHDICYIFNNKGVLGENVFSEAKK